MLVIILVLSVIVFVKTIGYAIYEYKDNNNKVAGIIISIFGFIALLGQIIIELID